MRLQIANFESLSAHESAAATSWIILSCSYQFWVSWPRLWGSHSCFMAKRKQQNSDPFSFGMKNLFLHFDWTGSFLLFSYWILGCQSVLSFALPVVRKRQYYVILEKLLILLFETWIGSIISASICFVRFV